MLWYVFLLLLLVCLDLVHLGARVRHVCLLASLGSRPLARGDRGKWEAAFQGTQVCEDVISSHESAEDPLGITW